MLSLARNCGEQLHVRAPDGACIVILIGRHGDVTSIVPAAYEVRGQVGPGPDDRTMHIHVPDGTRLSVIFNKGNRVAFDGPRAYTVMRGELLAFPAALSFPGGATLVRPFAA